MTGAFEFYFELFLMWGLLGIRDNVSGGNYFSINEFKKSVAFEFG